MVRAPWEKIIVPPVTKLVSGLRYKSPKGDDGVVVAPLPCTIVRVPFDIVKLLPLFKTSSFALVLFDACPFIVTVPPL